MAKKDKPKRERPPPTPKSPKPWDIPPVPRLGDLDADLTYRAVGRALTGWEKFERELAEIFSILTALKRRSLPATRAYGSILTLRGRVDLLKHAGEAAFAESPSKELRGQFADLLTAATNFGARRNEIAHGIVMRYRNLRTDPKSYVLAPSPLASNKFKFPKADLIEAGAPPEVRAAYIYSSAEIDVFAYHFDQLRSEAIKLAKVLWGHLGRSRRA